MGMELVGGEVLTAWAGAAVAPTTAVVSAATAVASSSVMGVELAGGETLTAHTGVVAAQTTEVPGAVTSPLTLTVARG
jgi:hypothetical protein